VVILQIFPAFAQTSIMILRSLSRDVFVYLDE